MDEIEAVQAETKQFHGQKEDQTRQDEEHDTRGGSKT